MTTAKGKRPVTSRARKQTPREAPEMSPSSIAKQANEVYLGPILMDANDPDAVGQYIGDELHFYFCPCQRCEVETDRIDHLIEANRAK